MGRLLITGKQKRIPLLVHFHGSTWIAEQAAVSRWKNVAVLALEIGTGSGAYGRPFSEPGRFEKLLQEARTASGVEFSRIVFSSWSAGYGAIRAILRDGGQPDSILLMDSLHAGYAADGKPGSLTREDVAPFVEYAHRGNLVLTHSEVFPGTFASTTEAVDFLIHELKLQHKPVLKWGPVGMQQISEARSKRVLVLGFAGNSAPDHVDHLYGMSEWLKKLPR